MKLNVIIIYSLYVLFLGYLYIFVFKIPPPDPGSWAGGQQFTIIDILIMGLAFLPFWLVVKLSEFIQKKRGNTKASPYISAAILKDSGFIFNVSDPFWTPLLSLILPPKCSRKLDALKSSSYIGREKRKVVHTPSCEVLKDKISEWETFEGFNSLEESEKTGFKRCRSCVF